MDQGVVINEETPNVSQTLLQSGAVAVQCFCHDAISKPNNKGKQKRKTGVAAGLRSQGVAAARVLKLCGARREGAVVWWQWGQSRGEMTVQMV